MFTNKGAQQAAFGYNDSNDLIATFYGACKTLNVHTKNVYTGNLHFKIYIFNYVSGSRNTINNTGSVKNTLDDLVHAWKKVIKLDPENLHVLTIWSPVKLSTNLAHRL